MSAKKRRANKNSKRKTIVGALSPTGPGVRTLPKEGGGKVTHI